MQHMVVQVGSVIFKAGKSIKSVDSFYFVNATLGTEFECYQQRNLLLCFRVQLDDD